MDSCIYTKLFIIDMINAYTTYTKYICNSLSFSSKNVIGPFFSSIKYNSY